jgi:diguanylate cyclase (GGDEF)-like protein/PAS domain S-box-containing protein
MKNFTISTRTILVVPILFTLLFIVKVFYNYNDSKANMHDYIHKQASMLNSFILVHRDYYQNLYLNKTIPLDAQTLKGLPAFSAFEIAQTFSSQNSFDISVQTVSNRARNPKNEADAFELEAIEFFKKSAHEKEYFVEKKHLYQYATPLYIEQKCLTCHGSKESAPEFISKTYDAAYDYKVGELRGVLSIQIPKERITKFFTFSLFGGILFDGFFLLAVFAIAYYFIHFFRSLAVNLENDVKTKTKELSHNLAIFKSYKYAMDEALLVTKSDLKGKITYANRQFLELTGYTKEEICEKPHSLLRHVDMPKHLYKEMWEQLQSGKTWKGVLKNKKKNNEAYWINSVIVPIRDSSGKTTEYIALRYDITELINKKELLEHIAYTDALTQLSNRVQLLRDLDKSRKKSLAIFNIDNFSFVNDFYGHAIGDSVIVRIGEILQEAIVRYKDYKLYHLKGDEFVLLSTTATKEEFLAVINEILLHVSQSIVMIVDEIHQFNFSVGISCEESETLATADMALKIAKQENKNLVFYSEQNSLAKEYKNNLSWSQEIKKALMEDRVVPFFQPIYSNVSQKFEKYESLVRIVKDDGSIVSPFFFLEIAKKSKQYIQITKVMIAKSFKQFKNSTQHLSINLTLEDILHDEIKQFILSMLKAYQIGERVVFEIVETELITDFEKVNGFIQSVKIYGCKIAIDDFGTGYSNFEYLLRLNPDFIKIDGSLIKDIDTNADKEIIVETIVTFARKKGIKIIAEFVENEAIVTKVKEMGIDYSQGYFYAKPSRDILPT